MIKQPDMEKRECLTQYELRGFELLQYMDTLPVCRINHID